MYHDWKIERREGEIVYIHIPWADLGFWNFGRNFCHRMALVAFRMDVVLILVLAVCVRLEAVHLCHCASSVSVDSLRCHFGKEGSRQFDFLKPSPGVVLLQLSPFYAQENQLRFFSSWTSARGFLIRCCVSSIAAHENPALAIIAIFKARCMSDCSSCTRPPCLAIVADMLETYQILVAASESEKRRLPLPYTLP